MIEQQTPASAARAVAEWFESRNPDDVGIILEGLAALGKSASQCSW